MFSVRRTGGCIARSRDGPPLFPSPSLPHFPSFFPDPQEERTLISNDPRGMSISLATLCVRCCSSTLQGSLVRRKTMEYRVHQKGFSWVTRIEHDSSTIGCLLARSSAVRHYGAKSQKWTSLFEGLCTGLSKRNGAKFRARTFRNWLIWLFMAGHFAWQHWRPEFSNRGKLFCTTLYINIEDFI